MKSIFKEMFTIRFTPLFNTTGDTFASVGLLLLRTGLSMSMIALHGWPKFSTYLNGTSAFPDPIGLGPEISLVLAIFAELVCSFLLLLGLFTRAAVIPLIVTMAVAIFIINSGESAIVREKGFIFLIVYVFFFLAGPGKYSLDVLLINKGK